MIALPAAIRFILPAAALVLFCPSQASSQIMASEPATLTQTIDGTEITIEYYRPRTRGRDPLFGPEAVVREEIWTPGANWATTISFEKRITVEGFEVEPGDWSIWMQMSEEEHLPETLVLDPEPRVFHLSGPEPRESQIRIPMDLEEGEAFFDLLTWDFTTLRNDGGTLAMRWGTKEATFDIGVEPSMRLHPTEEEVRAVVGDWEIELEAAAAATAGPPVQTMEIFLDEGTGMLSWSAGGMTRPDGVESRLIPVAKGVFLDTIWNDGEMLSGTEAYFEFELDDSGRAVRFTIREYFTDQHYVTGTRAR